MKKFLALLTTMIMTLSMVMTAMAASTGTDGFTITVPEKANHEYAIYQIFTGDLADGVLSNVKWGKNGKGTVGETVAEAILDELEAVNTEDATNDQKLDVIKKYVDLTGEAYAVGTKTNAPAGYYLIKDKNEVTGNDVATTYIVKVVNDVTLTPKGNVPTADKKIVEGENKVTDNDASIGDVINYEITGTLPSNLDDYKSYYYGFRDELSKGLTYKNDMKVTIGGVDVTEYFYISSAAAKNDDGEDVTLIKVAIQDIKALDNLNNVTIDSTTKIVLTYSATLNEDAVIAGAGNPNDVVLDYSNNPNDSGDPTPDTPPTPPTEEPKPTHPHGTTPEKEVKTYTTELTIQKVDESGKPLQGAEFTLSGDGVKKVLVKTETNFVEAEDGAYWKLADGTFTTTAPVTEAGKDNTADYDDVNKKYTSETTTSVKNEDGTWADVAAMVDESGKVTFTGLGEGHYTLTETKTPAGYNTIAPITFDVSYASGAFTATEPIELESDNTLYTEIENQKGTTLPETGGMGTTMFYVFGAILVAAAGVLLITKKRMAVR